MKPVVFGLAVGCIFLLAIGGRNLRPARGGAVHSEPPIQVEAASDPAKSVGVSMKRAVRSGRQAATNGASWPDRIAMFDAEPDSDRRDALLERLADGVGSTQRIAALDALVGDQRPAAVELKRLLLTQWAEAEPRDAARWAVVQPAGPLRTEALERVATAWANQDAAAAVAWLQTLETDLDRTTATWGVAYEVARTDPLSALTMASELPATRERDELILHAVGQWSSQDADAAAHWSAQVPDPALRQRLLGAAAVSAADTDGPQGAQIAVQNLNGADERDRAIIGVVQRWAQNAPAAAAGWISQFPEVAVRTLATQTLVERWAVNDAQAAGEWVRDLPEGNLRELAMTAYVRALSEEYVTPTP